jgi:hypothetical protein
MENEVIETEDKLLLKIPCVAASRGLPAVVAPIPLSLNTDCTAAVVACTPSQRWNHLWRVVHPVFVMAVQ